MPVGDNKPPLGRSYAFRHIHTVGPYTLNTQHRGTYSVNELAVSLEKHNWSDLLIGMPVGDDARDPRPRIPRDREKRPLPRSGGSGRASVS
jgi:hypothetical protein